MFSPPQHIIGDADSMAQCGLNFNLPQHIDSFYSASTLQTCSYLRQVLLWRTLRLCRGHAVSLGVLDQWRSGHVWASLYTCSRRLQPHVWAGAKPILSTVYSPGSANHANTVTNRDGTGSQARTGSGAEATATPKLGRTPIIKHTRGTGIYFRLAVIHDPRPFVTYLHARFTLLSFSGSRRPSFSLS